MLTMMFLAGCAAAPPPAAAPEWDAVPAGIVEALCRRLQMDAIATGRTTIVRVTRPLITQQNVAALSLLSSRARRPRPVVLANRAIPVEIGQGGCSWTPIDPAAMAARSDEMIVELSAPLANPYTTAEAGLFARITLGGEEHSAYWIALVPHAGGWVVRFVSVLFR